MEHLKELIQNLAAFEKERIMLFLQSISSRKKNQSLQLFELIIKNPNITIPEVQDKIFDGRNTKSLFYLKKKLYTQIIDFLFLTKHAGTPNKEWKEGFVFLLKKVSASVLLQQRGLESHSVFLLQECIKEAQRFHYHSIETISYDRLFKIMEDHSNEDLNNNLAGFNQAIFNQNIYYQLLQYELKWHFLYKKRASQNELLPLIGEFSSPSFEKKINQSSSTRVKIRYNNLMIRKYEIEGDFAEIERRLLEIERIIDGDRDLTKLKLKGGLYFRFYLFHLKQFNFLDALVSINKSIMFYPISSKNGQMVISEKFTTLIYLQRFEEAERVFEEFTLIPEAEINNSDWELMLLNRGWLALLQGDFSKGITTLNEIVDLPKTKEKSIYWIRIIEILLVIEAGKIDLLSTKIDALRKSLKKFDESSRIRKILNLIRRVEYVSCDFKKIKQDDVLLRELDQEPVWVPGGLELVPVQNWVRCKIDPSPKTKERLFSPPKD